MATSDVRSIDSLRNLKAGLVELAHQWDGSLQQIKVSLHRIEEHFSVERPAYWKKEVRKAEQTLTEAMDNLSSQQGNASDGNGPALSEARQRVQIAKRRLEWCEEKLRAAKRIAIQVDRICQEVAGPIADVSSHVEVSLPRAASTLAEWVGHLDRYTETSSFALEPQTRNSATTHGDSGSMPEPVTPSDVMPPENASSESATP